MFLPSWNAFSETKRAPVDPNAKPLSAPQQVICGIDPAKTPSVTTVVKVKNFPDQLRDEYLRIFRDLPPLKFANHNPNPLLVDRSGNIIGIIK